MHVFFTNLFPFISFFFFSQKEKAEEEKQAKENQNNEQKSVVTVSSSEVHLNASTVYSRCYDQSIRTEKNEKNPV